MNANPKPSTLQKVSRLIANLDAFPQIVIAFSGGVDSSLLLKLATLSKCPDLTAVTAISASFPKSEQYKAREFARMLGVRHVELKTNELDIPNYRANRGDRCYYCRKTLFEHTTLNVKITPSGVVCYGAIPDDLGDHRPGMRAADEANVRAPLIEAKLTKAEIRMLARHYNLSVWDTPASACLASRFPTGVEVTHARLKQVENCEAKLAKLGFKQIRARFHYDLVRIELDPDALARTQTDSALAASVIACGLAAGFSSVEIDPNGYRMGSVHQPALVTINER